MRIPAHRTLALVVSVLVLAACGGSEVKPEDEALIDKSAQFATTTTSVDPWAVPATIDAEYVRRVLQRIDDVRAEVRRDVFATHQFTDADRKKIEAIYTGHKLASGLSEWSTTAPLDHSEFKPLPGNAVIAVQVVLKASQDCIWANATFDETAARLVAKVPTQGQVVLVVASHDRLVNPTPWMVRRTTVPGQLSEVDACG